MEILFGKEFDENRMKKVLARARWFIPLFTTIAIILMFLIYGLGYLMYFIAVFLILDYLFYKKYYTYERLKYVLVYDVGIKYVFTDKLYTFDKIKKLHFENDDADAKLTINDEVLDVTFATVKDISRFKKVIELKGYQL